MQIIGLEAQNFKKLKAVNLKLDGGNLIVGGANESGKSSVLDAIYVGFGGPDVQKELQISKPIREGAESASVKIELDDLIITRNWNSNDKSNVTVTSKDGAKYGSPQGMLNALVGKAFDLSGFLREKPADQRETLLGIIDIGIDLNQWEIDRKKVYESRTEINREVTRLENTLKSMPSYPDAPELEVSSSTVLAEMQKAQDVKDANDAERRELETLGGICRQVNDKITEQERQIGELEDRIVALKISLSGNKTTWQEYIDKAEKQKVFVESLIDPDMGQFNSRLSEVESLNSQVRANQQRQTVAEQAKEANLQSKKLTAQISTLDKGKADAIRAAKFPIEGLAFDESGITYKDIPFGQCSSEERLRVAMAIAMAMNPRLKVIRISDGSLLDEKNFKLIQEMAADKGYQILCEVVGDPGEMGVIIEDGEIAGSETKGA